MCQETKPTKTLHTMKSLSNSWTAKQFIANLNPVVVGHSKDETGVSVCVRTSNGKKAMRFWIDLWKDKGGEIAYDWNQYIFNTMNEDDCLRMEMQQDCYFFEMMTSEALYYVQANGLL